MSSALFGVLIGAAWFVLTTRLPQPGGSIVFWGSIAGYLGGAGSL